MNKMENELLELMCCFYNAYAVELTNSRSGIECKFIAEFEKQFMTIYLHNYSIISVRKVDIMCCSFAVETR